MNLPAGVQHNKVGFYMTSGLRRYMNSVRGMASKSQSILMEASIGEYLSTMIQHFRHSPKHRKAEEVHKAIDKIIKDKMHVDPDSKLVKCQRGCNACCYVRVEATASEAKLLDGVEIDESRVRRQMVADTVEEWSKIPWEDKLCVFNKDGQCSVYENRPTSCRLYFVASDPKYCNHRDYPDHPVLNYQVHEAESLASAWFHFNWERDQVGTLPAMLAKVRGL